MKANPFAERYSPRLRADSLDLLLVFGHPFSAGGLRDSGSELQTQNPPQQLKHFRFFDWKHGVPRATGLQQVRREPEVLRAAASAPVRVPRVGENADRPRWLSGGLQTLRGER